MTEHPTQLLTPEAVAERLGGVEPAYVKRQCREGGWPHVRVGRKYLLTEEQYEEIVQLLTIRPGPSSPPPRELAPRATRGRRAPVRLKSARK